MFISYQLQSYKPGGYTHVKAYRDVPAKCVSFHQTSLDKGHFWQKKKIFRRGSHFTKIVKKLLNQPFFRQKKPLELGPDLWKFRKNQPFFEREKSLQMGKGFWPSATHPSKINSTAHSVKNSFKYPPPPGYKSLQGGPNFTRLYFPSNIECFRVSMY